MTTTRFWISAAMILFLIAPLHGQNEDNALTYSYDRPTGTARSIGLGGAMGALGGDYSAIGINPAGIAIYRSSEFAFTPSLIFNQSESYYDRTNDYKEYSNNKTTNDKISVPINHISYVGTNKSMRDANNGIVSTHFGIGYNRTNNFNRKSFIHGEKIQSSLLDEFIDQANTSGLTPFYSQLAFNSFLIDPIDEDENQNQNEYYSAFEYIDDNDIIQWGPKDGLDQSRIISEKGGTGEFNLTFGGNYSNLLYMGGSLDISTIRYEKDYEHNEKPSNKDQWDYLTHYSFNEYSKTTGTGLGLKLGAILKPFKQMRLGATIHTPTFYSMTEEYSTEVELPEGFAEKKVYKSDEIGESSYNFRTPLKAIMSFAYFLGNKGLISVDYEYANYGTMEFNSNDTDVQSAETYSDLNEIVSKTFKKTHNFKFGLEYRITPSFSLRSGFATYQNPYDGNLNIYDEEEENIEDSFEIIKQNYDVSGGFGFRHGNMNIDVAYLYRYLNYTNSLYYASHVSDTYQYPADMTSTDHQLAVTLGWRF